MMKSLVLLISFLFLAINTKALNLQKIVNACDLFDADYSETLLETFEELDAIVIELLNTKDYKQYEQAYERAHISFVAEYTKSIANSTLIDDYILVNEMTRFKRHNKNRIERFMHNLERLQRERKNAHYQVSDSIEGFEQCIMFLFTDYVN